MATEQRICTAPFSGYSLVNGCLFNRYLFNLCVKLQQTLNPKCKQDGPIEAKMPRTPHHC